MNKSLSIKIKCAIIKFISAKIAPYSVLNGVRIFLYRLCGYKIGKNVFIGMRCYFDDLEPRLLTIEDNVIISYGVFFACHGIRQSHTPITIKRGAYLGMRSNVVSSKNGVVIGEGAIVGACSLVLSDIPDHATAVGIPAQVSYAPHLRSLPCCRR
jgi:acetyltransferase-like isoleucine patch superfamily enzyme